jgi:hypothetical protein
VGIEGNCVLPGRNFCGAKAGFFVINTNSAGMRLRACSMNGKASAILRSGNPNIPQAIGVAAYFHIAVNSAGALVHGPGGQSGNGPVLIADQADV